MKSITIDTRLFIILWTREIVLISDIVTYEECNKDEEDPVEDKMFDPSTGTFTSQSDEPSLFFFSATSLLKSEYNSPVYLQIIKHRPDNGEKVRRFQII